MTGAEGFDGEGCEASPDPGSIPGASTITQEELRAFVEEHGCEIIREVLRRALLDLIARHEAGELDLEDPESWTEGPGKA